MRRGATKKSGVGSSFDDFLKEEGTYEVTAAVAIKRLLAWEVANAIKERALGRKAPAEPSSDHDRAP